MAQVNRRQAQTLDGFGHLKAFDTSNDAVALPILQPTGSEITQAALLQEDGPWIVRAKILGDAQKQSTPEGARGFNEQRYAWTAGMFGIVLHAAIMLAWWSYDKESQSFSGIIKPDLLKTEATV